jgi:hypothetical protein
MSKALLLGWLTRVRLDADEEAALEVDERIQVEENRVDRVLRYNILLSQSLLVVLCGMSARCWTIDSKPRAHLQDFEVLDVFAFRLDDLAHDLAAVIEGGDGPLFACWQDSGLEQEAALLESIEEGGDGIDDLPEGVSQGQSRAEVTAHLCRSRGVGAIELVDEEAALGIEIAELGIARHDELHGAGLARLEVVARCDGVDVELPIEVEGVEEEAEARAKAEGMTDCTDGIVGRGPIGI